MLRLAKTLSDIPIMSLRVGGQIAIATQPIINPNNLKIEGWWCEDVQSRERLILTTDTIREIIPEGLVVNDHEDLSQAEDLVRLKETIDLQFTLIGKPVITTEKQKLGKVIDYSAESNSMIIQKLYLSQPIMKTFAGGSLTIDRTQIIEITDRKIIVNPPEEKIYAEQSVAVPA